MTFLPTGETKMLAMFIVAWRDKTNGEVRSDWFTNQVDAEKEAFSVNGVCFQVTSPIDFTQKRLLLSFDFCQACAETIGKEFLKEAGLWVIPSRDGDDGTTEPGKLSDYEGTEPLYE